VRGHVTAARGSFVTLARQEEAGPSKGGSAWKKLRGKSLADGRVINFARG